MSFSLSSPPRLRFLVVGPVSPRPTGRRERLALADLPGRLSAAPLQVKVDVGAAIGAAGPKVVAASFSRFREFSAAEVVTQAFGELQRLATRLTASGGRPRADEFLAAVERAVGRGPLHAELSRCFAPPAAAPPVTGGAAALVDELLAQGQPRGAAAVIDAVVRGGVSSTPAGAEAGAAKAAHACLSAALGRAALAVLADPAVRAAEVRWRGLKLFLGQCPRDQAIEVELLDVPAGQEAAALGELTAADALAQPDLVVVIDPVGSLEGLAGLAEAGADLHAPVIAEVSPGALAAEGAAALAGRAAEGGLGDGWAGLRAAPASRWLAAVVNPPALVAEATASGERVVCGGAALAVAGLLAGSFRDAGVFSRLGVEADLRAPATWHMHHVREDIALSLAEPLSVDQQVALGRAGLCALAGPVNSEVVALAGCPVVAASEEPTSAGGQLLAGRTVRFALWIRGQLSAGADPQQAGELVIRAAALLLLPGTQSRPRFGAAIEGGALRVAASFSAALAGVPVVLQFALPLE